MPDPHNPVEILPGVRHYQTSGFAVTREVYDALSKDDGWQEGKCEGTAWKDGTINRRKIVVFAPHKPREGGGADVS